MLNLALRASFGTLALPLLLTASPLAAQQVARFDVGPHGQTVAAGWTSVVPQTLYDPLAGYGWVSGAAPASAFADAVLPQCVYLEEELPGDVLADGVESPTYTFRFDGSAATRWQVTVILGRMGTVPYEGMDVRANGTTVVDDAFARLARGKAILVDAWGGYKRCTFLTGTDAAGLVDLEFDAAGGVPLMGIELRPHENEPVRFQHALPGLVSTSGYAYLDAALNLINAADYAGAKAALDAIAPQGKELGLAYAYAWLAGWLDGAMEDVDTALLDRVETLLPAAPDGAAKAFLLRDLRHFRAGELFLRTRGYSPEAFPENPDSLYDLYPVVDPNPPILLNSWAGVQLLEQIDGSILSLSPVLHRPHSPFFAKAQYLIARNMYGRKTKVGLGVAGLTYNQYLIGILDRLWPRLDPNASTEVFEEADEAITLVWYVREHLATPDGKLDPWQPGTYPPVDFATTWYAPFTEFADHPSAPEWANQQRRYGRMFRDLARWWVENRMLSGELGGGAGDDTEAAGLAMPSVTSANHPTHPVETGWKEMLEHVLFGDEVHQEQGYWHQTGTGSLYIDAEHGGEYTSYPLLLLMPKYAGDPTYVEFAMRTSRNMIEANPATRWTDLPGWSVGRHFKALRLSAHGHDGSGADCTENAKVIYPAVHLLAYNGDPTVRSTLDELCRAWADAAMRTEHGKPAGLLPPAISFANGSYLLDGNMWWSAPPFGGSYGAQYDTLYAMMREVALTHPPTSTEAQALLAPIRSTVDYLLSTASVVPPAFPDPGTEEWLVQKTRGFGGAAAFFARRELVETFSGADPTIGTRVQDVIDAYAGPYPKYLTSTQASKDESEIADLFEVESDWLRHFWPLATKTVTYMDRIQSGNLQGLHNLYATAGGTMFGGLPLYPVTWYDPTADQNDLAILVHHLDPGASSPGDVALRALLFNFDAAPEPLGLKLRRDLPLGTYDVCIGPDGDLDDAIDLGLETCTSATFEVHGDSVEVDVPPGALQVLELRLSSALPPPAATLPDPAIGAGDLERDGDVLHVEVHNIGAASYAGGWARVSQVLPDQSEVLVGGEPIPTIAAPSGLTPSSVSIDVDLPTQLPHPATLRVRLKHATGFVQITDANDEATVTE